MSVRRIVADRFEVGDFARAGGMGDVYTARDRTTGEKVALKVIPESTAEIAERFLREAKILAEIAHPAIVGHVAHGVDEGLPYLVMRWVPGSSLQDHLAGGATLSVHETEVLARRLAEALATIHGRGIVHRDLKPSNVILEDGRVDRAVLLDFGIAHILESGLELTQTGDLIGTPGYMSPEQAQGAEIDARTDVFSLGCVIFRCLAGRPPFESRNSLSAAVKVLIEDAPRLSEHASGVPPTLDDFVERMLARDPTRRPRDGAAVLRVLSGSSEDTLSEASDTGTLPTVRKLGRGERRLMSLVLARRVDWEPTPAAVAAVRDILDERLEAFDMHASVLADGSIVAAVHDDAVQDAALRAARAALVIVEELGDAQVALATGRGVMDDDVPVGEIVDRAIELLEFAHKGVVVDSTSASLLAGRFAVEERAEPAGTVRVLVGESRGVRTLLGQPSSFIGRTRELVTLEAMLDECRTESVARVMVVSAEPGVGKSRLCAEFVGRAQNGGVRVWIAYGEPATRGSPLALLRGLVLSAADVQDDDPLAECRRKVVEHAARLGCAPDIVEFLSEFVAPVAEPGDALRAARRDRLLFADRLRTAWEALVVAAVRVGPLAIVLEDLHWGDQRSVELIDGALAVASALPLFVLALARPGGETDFAVRFGAHGMQEMRLLGLTPRASAELVRSALGGRATDAVTNAIVARAQGNVLFIEELIRAVADGRDDIPESLVAMMERRLSSLDVPARRVLRAAAVLGEAASADGVLALVGGQRVAVEGVLARLAMREVFVAQDGRYAFRHALLREAAYATLTDEDRRLGHQLAGEWLESKGAADPVVLAGHFLASGQRERARKWLFEAAAAALAKNDLKAALGYAGQVEALDPPPDTLGGVRMLQAEANLWTDDPAALSQTAELLTLVPPRSAMWYRAAAGLLFVAGQTAELSKIVEVVRRLEEDGPEAPDTETVSTQIMAFSMATWLLTMLGIHERARTFYVRARALESRADTGALGWLEIARVYMKKYVLADPWGALVAVRGAKSCFALIGDVRLTVLAQVLEGAILYELGAYEEGITLLDEASVTCGKVEFKAARSACVREKGNMYEELGRLQESLELERAAQLEVHTTLQHRNVAKASEASVLLKLGNAREARDAARDASFELTFMPSQCSHALATLARAELACGNEEAARDAANRAVAIVDALGVIGGGESPVFVALALVHEARGDHASAAVAVERGAGLVRARAAKIEDPRYRKDFEELVAANAWLLDRAKR